MNSKASPFPKGRVSSSPLCLAVIALIFASLQPGITVASEDGSSVVLGRLESTSIKYHGLGKSSGAEYSGTAKIEVLEVLKDEGALLQKHGTATNKSRYLVLKVEEHQKKPSWEIKKGQSFIFVLESIAGADQFRVLDVTSPDPEKIQRIKQTGTLSHDALEQVLHPREKK
jgi:hypothetical protein